MGLWLLLVGVCLCLASGRASAQDADPTDEAEGVQATTLDAPRADARQLVVRAVGEYNAGRYAEAYALFSRAHELEPTARTLRSMGMVLFELRRYVGSAQRLSLALIEERRPLTDSQREQTRTLLERARQFVARVVVHVEPEDAILTLDGEPVELVDGELDLDAGNYTLMAQCEGCQSQSVRIRALAGESREITLTLAELSETSPDAPPALPPLPERPSLVAPALMMSAGVVLALAAVPTGLVARQAEDKLREQCPRNICDGSLRSTRDRANTFALLTDILWATGAALGSAGLVWLLLRRSSGHPVDVNVACGPRGCTSSLTGRF
jgi:tetratricopeptide (TPR) repeat protein